MNQVQATNAVSDGIQQRQMIDRAIGARIFLAIIVLPMFLGCLFGNKIKDTWMVGTIVTLPTVLMASVNIKKLRS